MSRRLSWKPRRRGNIYCAPACGGGCTWAGYEKATGDANALAKRLGAGWQPRVTESLGWHVSALSSCGRLYVVPCWNSGGKGNRLPGPFLAFLGEPNSFSGKWTAYGRTPSAAVRNVLSVARADVAHMTAMIEEACP